MAAGVSETRLPLITHNTLIFLLCSYVGSNGSCMLADCGYAAQLFTFLVICFRRILTYYTLLRRCNLLYFYLNKCKSMSTENSLDWVYTILFK